MNNQKINKNSNQLINQAWMRNGELEPITGEGLILVCLLHSTGAGRHSEEMQDLLRIMNDPNVEEE